MPKKLRPGDIVTFKAVVTSVAPHDGGQQICARLTPNGKELGWCVPGEYDFEPVELKIKVGDIVNIVDRPGHEGGWEVMALFNDDQVAIKKVGNWPVQMEVLKNLRRR